MEGMFVQPRVYTGSFSVNVAVPMSGCEMMTNVRRLWISAVMLTKVGNGNIGTGADKEGKCGFPNQTAKDANYANSFQRKADKLQSTAPLMNAD
jgi:hypothetical protein